MKTKISEQELTDYALNELGPEERIYVETVLAGSEESREDVYAMIELAMTLEEGFEKQAGREPAVLTPTQHQALLSVPAPNLFLRNSLAILAAAACVTFALVQRDAWLPRVQWSQHAPTMAGSPAHSGFQARVESRKPDLVSQILQVRELTDDPLLQKWFQSLPAVGSSAPVDYDMQLESFESLMP